VEDFTVYTEVDGSAVLTVTASKITGADLDRDINAYIYKDFGTDHFDAIEINFEVCMESTSVNTAVAVLPGLTVGTVGPNSTWGSGDVAVTLEKAATSLLQLWRGYSAALDTYAISLDTLYYCTLSRASGADTITLKIYSDAARITLLDTLSVSGFGTSKYRYLYGICGLNDALDGRNFDGYIQNLDISPFIPRVIIF